jgi:hypothetical protein
MKGPIMTLVCNSPEKIIFNELKALFFIDKNQFDIAERLLLKNIEERTDSILTYNLLIKVYNEKNDYNGLLMTLNLGIKSTGKKDFYRKLKKQVILSRIIKDLKCIQGSTNSQDIN